MNAEKKWHWCAIAVCSRLRWFKNVANALEKRVQAGNHLKDAKIEILKANIHKSVKFMWDHRCSMRRDAKFLKFNSYQTK